MSPPEKNKESGFTDSIGCELIIIEGGGDTTVRPTDPRLREEIERRMHRWRMLPPQPPSDESKPESAPPSA
jgi:hypothetical protein